MVVCQAVDIGWGLVTGMTTFGLETRSLSPHPSTPPSLFQEMRFFDWFLSRDAMRHKCPITCAGQEPGTLSPPATDHCL